VFIDVCDKCLNSNITISRQLEDAALYTCVASNVAGETSRDINLDVYSTPSIEGSDVTETHDVNRGQYFSLECTVTGYPRPDVEVGESLASIEKQSSCMKEMTQHSGDIVITYEQNNVKTENVSSWWDVSVAQKDKCLS